MRTSPDDEFSRRVTALLWRGGYTTTKLSLLRLTNALCRALHTGWLAS
jgi:hypothetical protein